MFKNLVIAVLVALAVAACGDAPTVEETPAPLTATSTPTTVEVQRDVGTELDGRREVYGAALDETPDVLGDLTIDYPLRRVSLAGRPVQMTAIEYRTLAELSANAGRVLTYEHLLRRVWRLEVDADLRPIRTAISSLRRKLGDDAEDPTYIFTELRVGYRMPKGETPEYVETSEGVL